MFTEIATRRTHSQGHRRRWFQSDSMDLYTWQDEANVLLGFQLAYDRRADQRAITWIRDRGYFHARIDEDTRGLVASTPLLQREGNFDAHRTHANFIEAAAGLDEDIALFVSTKLRAYHESERARSSSIWNRLLVAALAGAIIGLAIRRLWK
jgi:hypothetical protein